MYLKCAELLPHNGTLLSSQQQLSVQVEYLCEGLLFFQLDQLYLRQLEVSQYVFALKLLLIALRLSDHHIVNNWNTSNIDNAIPEAYRLNEVISITFFIKAVFN